MPRGFAEDGRAPEKQKIFGTPLRPMRVIE
jgi:hypothetical protein